MNRKDYQDMYNGNVNVNLLVENVTQIQSWIMVNVNVSAKNTRYLTMIKFVILLHVVDKMCDEIIDAEESKTILKSMIVKTESS